MRQLALCLQSVYVKNTKSPQLTELQGFQLPLAERTRFELVVGLLLRQFSKLVVSATHPPLLDCGLAVFRDAKLELYFDMTKFFRDFF